MKRPSSPAERDLLVNNASLFATLRKKIRSNGWPKGKIAKLRPRRRDPRANVCELSRARNKLQLRGGSLQPFHARLILRAICIRCREKLTPFRRNERDGDAGSEMESISSAIA